jgi:ATP-dependent exoDNAse (exonuclease V) alpha subunit
VDLVNCHRNSRNSHRNSTVIRNNYTAEHLNGSTAIVVAVDPQGSSVVVQKDDGERQRLDLRHLADRHTRPGGVRTITSAQGATCDRVTAHLESFRANTVDTRAAYVAISRARTGAAIYTDSRAKLTEALGSRDGAQVGAIDATIMLQNLRTGTDSYQAEMG